MAAMWRVLAPLRRAGLWLVLALAGCAGEPLPAMVAIADAGSYGFADGALGAGRYDVSYTTPWLRVSTAGDKRAEELAAERQRAHDLALWHAARVALREGFGSFSLVQERQDSDVDIETYLGPSSFDRFGDPFCFARWRRHPFTHDFCDFDYYPRYDRRARARVTTRFTIALEPGADEGDFDAAATERRLAAAYAGATYPQVY